MSAAYNHDLCTMGDLHLCLAKDTLTHSISAKDSKRLNGGFWVHADVQAGKVALTVRCSRRTATDLNGHLDNSRPR